MWVILCKRCNRLSHILTVPLQELHLKIVVASSLSPNSMRLGPTLQHKPMQLAQSSITRPQPGPATNMAQGGTTRKGRGAESYS